MNKIFVNKQKELYLIKKMCHEHYYNYYDMQQLWIIKFQVLHEYYLSSTE